jgi:hypothetical protein
VKEGLLDDRKRQPRVKLTVKGAHLTHEIRCNLRERFRVALPKLAEKKPRRSSRQIRFQTVELNRLLGELLCLLRVGDVLTELLLREDDVAESGQILKELLVVCPDLSDCGTTLNADLLAFIVLVLVVAFLILFLFVVIVLLIIVVLIISIVIVLVVGVIVGVVAFASLSRTITIARRAITALIRIRIVSLVAGAIIVTLVAVSTIIGVQEVKILLEVLIATLPTDVSATATSTALVVGEDRLNLKQLPDVHLRLLSVN